LITHCAAGLRDGLQKNFALITKVCFNLPALAINFFGGFMNSVLKFIFVVIPLLLVFTFEASAQSRRRRTTYDSGTSYSDTSTTSSSSISSGGGNAGRMAVGGGIGFYGSGGATYVQGTSTASPALTGMFGLGGDFDYYLADDFSVGGVFRYYSTSDTVNSTEYSNTLMTIGGIARAHVFETANWSGNISTGFGMLSATVKSGNSTVDPGTNFGLYFGLATFYKFSSSMHIGFENLRMMGLGTATNGWPLSDFFIKARFFM
jgi:hypothetical protein